MEAQNTKNQRRILLGKESSGEEFSEAKNYPANNSLRRRIKRAKNFPAKNYPSGYLGKNYPDEE
jgi:hypothetical protein